MKIQKSISTGLLYLAKISSFLTLLNPIVTKATVVRNPAKSVKTLIALFNNGVPSTTITKSPLGNLGNVNVQSSINKLNQSNITSTTSTKSPLKSSLLGLNSRTSSSLSVNSTPTLKTLLKNNLSNLSSRSSSSLSVNSTASTSSSKETVTNVNVGSIVSRFEAAIKNYNQTTSPQKK